MTENRELKDNMVPDSVSHQQMSEIALRKVVREAALSVERTRWFVASIILAIALVLLMMAYINLSVKQENKHDVAWVKMYKNGLWDIEFHDSAKALEVLPATIDSLLIQWTERRFSEVKESVRFDYGYVNLFMSDELSADFVASNGFNAAQKAVNVMECSNCLNMRYKVNIVDHFDSDAANFGGVEGGLYRTNIFVTKKIMNDGESTDVQDKRLVRIDWRLMSQDEIKNKAQKEGGMDWLHKNPVGMEILAYEEFDDESDRKVLNEQ